MNNKTVEAILEKARIALQKNGQKTKPNQKDENYIIDLCDKVLNDNASRQHRFDFLVGDTGRKLPVDAYYEKCQLVIKYYEKQHTETVKLFDKKNTVSGVTRDVQRRIYDKRRKEVLPQHGIEVIILSYSDFDFDNQKKIIRNPEKDLEIIRQKLKKFISHK